jgi:hypothetical protein
MGRDEGGDSKKYSRRAAVTSGLSTSPLSSLDYFVHDLFLFFTSEQEQQSTEMPTVRRIV